MRSSGIYGIDFVDDLNCTWNKQVPTRSSGLFNEDNYDYAIELAPDDEYRQVAEQLPEIVDFDEIEIVAPDDDSSLNDPYCCDHSVKPFSFYDNHNNNHVTNNEFPAEDLDFRDIEANFISDDMVDDEEAPPGNNESEERWKLTRNDSNNSNSSLRSLSDLVTKKHFSFRLKFLEKQKRWVEKAARRSSIGYYERYFSNEKEAMDRFLLMMAKGIHIRRHQKQKVAETVRLFSTTGCKIIEWERGATNANNEAETESGGGRATILSLQRSSQLYQQYLDMSLFHCFIAICGCGDDLPSHPHQDTRDEADRNSSVPNNNLSSSSISTSCWSCLMKPFYNFGYKYSGNFSNDDIIAVHPSTKEDPTAPGMYATEDLRDSKDIFNQELTFSIIIKDPIVSYRRGGINQSGYMSLDIECFTEEEYFVLLRGFSFLLEENLQRRRDEREGERDQELASTTNKGNVALWERTTTEISGIYKSAKEAVLSFHHKKHDPLADLFAPNYSIDPFRAIRVGGGLLPKGFGLGFSPSKKSHPNSLALNKHMLTQNNKSNCSVLSSISQGSSTYRLPLAQFLGWKSAGTQIWARLKMAGLDVKCVFSTDLSRIILKIRCPRWRLEQMAEQMHLKIRTKSGHLKAFRVSRRDSFIPFGSRGNIFRSSERQQIIDYIIRSKIVDGGAELDSRTELGRFIVQRFPLHMYPRIEDIRHSWVTFWKREAYGETPEPWSPFRAPYRETWQRWKASTHHFFSNLLNQPLDNVAEYFGENIAFYFAFMAFYTRWLVFPSVLGIILFIVQVSTKTLDHWLCVPYAVLIMIWISFLLVFWRQKASTLAYRWGVLDYEVDETERPEFHGKEVVDDYTGEIRKIYPLQKRFMRYLFTTPIWTGVIVLTLLIMAVIFYSQDKLYDDYYDHKPLDYTPAFPPLRRHLSENQTSSASSAGNVALTWSQLGESRFWAVTFFYPSLYGICVSLISICFHLLAKWLNEIENHPTQTIFMNRLILKVFSFEFVSIFTSLYYYAFFLKRGEGENADVAYMRISVTILSLMTVGQWWKVFLDLSIPSLYHRALQYRMRLTIAQVNRKVYAAKEWTESQKQGRRESESSSSSPTIPFEDKEQVQEMEKIRKQLEKRINLLQQGKSKCWEEALQAKYNTFSDYTHMIIQMGFILCFGAVFPLAPLIALINNLLLIRFNALKICYTRQRPIAQKVGGIGVWSDVTQILSIGGVLTNCALFGFVSQPLSTLLVPLIGETGLALLLFGYEQVLLLFKYWLHTSIPSTPQSVQRAQIRERKSISRRSLARVKQQQHALKRASFHGDGGDGGGGQGGGAAAVGSGAKKSHRKHSSFFGGIIRRISVMNLFEPLKMHGAGSSHPQRQSEEHGSEQIDEHIAELPHFRKRHQSDYHYPHRYAGSPISASVSPALPSTSVNGEIVDHAPCHTEVPFQTHQVEEEVEEEEQGRPLLSPPLPNSENLDESTIYSPPSEEYLPEEEDLEEDLPPPDEEEDEDAAIFSREKVDEKSLQRKYSKLLASRSRSRSQSKSHSRDAFHPRLVHSREPGLMPESVVAESRRRQSSLLPRSEERLSPRKSVLSLDEYDDDEDEDEGFNLLSPIQEVVEQCSGFFSPDKSDYHPSPINRYSQRKQLLEPTITRSPPEFPPTAMDSLSQAKAGSTKEKVLWQMRFSLEGSEDISGSTETSLRSEKSEGKPSPAIDSPNQDLSPVPLQSPSPSPPPMKSPRVSPVKEMSLAASDLSPSSLPKVNSKRRKSSLLAGKKSLVISPPTLSVKKSRQSSLLKQSIQNHTRKTSQLPSPQLSPPPQNPSSNVAKSRRLSVLSGKSPELTFPDNTAKEVPLKRTSPLKQVDVSRGFKSSSEVKPHENDTSRQPLNTIHSVVQMIPFVDSPPLPPHPSSHSRQKTSSMASERSNQKKSVTPTSALSKSPSQSNKRTLSGSEKSKASPLSASKSRDVPSRLSTNTPNSGKKATPLKRSNTSTRHLFPPIENPSPFASITETMQLPPTRILSLLGNVNDGDSLGEEEDKEVLKENSPKAANQSPRRSPPKLEIEMSPLSSPKAAVIQIDSPTVDKQSTAVPANQRSNLRNKMGQNRGNHASAAAPPSSAANLSFIPFNPFTFLSSHPPHSNQAPPVSSETKDAPTPVRPNLLGLLSPYSNGKQKPERIQFE